VIVNYYTLNNVGPITISGQTSPDRLRTALKALDTETARSAQGGLLQRGRNGRRQGAARPSPSAFEREKASAFSHTIGFWWSVSGLEYYLKYVDEMARRSPAQLQEYARKYIIDRARVVGVLLSPAARAQLNLTDDELSRWGAPPPQATPAAPSGAHRPPEGPGDAATLPAVRRRALQCHVRRGATASTPRCRAAAAAGGHHRAPGHVHHELHGKRVRVIHRAGPPT